MTPTQALTMAREALIDCKEATQGKSYDLVFLAQSSQKTAAAISAIDAALAAPAAPQALPALLQDTDAALSKALAGTPEAYAQTDAIKRALVYAQPAVQAVGPSDGMSDGQKEAALLAPYDSHDMSAVCTRCGETWGGHNGALCPNGSGTFAAPVAPQSSHVAAALATLNRLGYTWEGGELFKPPLGPQPVFVPRAPRYIETDPPAAPVAPQAVPQLNAMQEATDRYTLKSSRMAFVEGAAWAASALASARLAEELSAAPVAKPQPLTDEQIDAVTREQWGPQLGAMVQAHRAYARAVLKLAGISAQGGE